MSTLFAPFEHVPQEVLDMIIDFLYCDKISLQMCSLVATAWLCPSRFHLFHKLTLRPRDLLEAPAVLARSPEICVSVRVLKITEGSLLEELSTIDPLALFTALTLLPNVRHIHLDKVCLPRATNTGTALVHAPSVTGVAPLPKWQPPFRRELCKLRATPRTYDVRELLRGLAFFAATPVRELRIDDAVWTSGADAGSVQPPSTACYDALRGWRVGALVVPEHCPLDLAELVCYASTAGIAHTIVLLDVGRNHGKLIAFLTKVGSSITSLEWCLDDPDGWSYWTRMTPAYWWPLASECASLESICFTIHPTCLKKASAVVEHAIPQLNKDIRRITLALRLPLNPMDPHYAHGWLTTWVMETRWGLARQALAGRCRLEYVAVVLAPKDGVAVHPRYARWLRESLAQELPELHSMGKLRFGEV